MTPKIRKNAKNASPATPPALSPLATAIATAAATAATAATDAPAVNPPLRVGGPSALVPRVAAASLFTFRGILLNGTPSPKPADALTLAPVTLAATDAPALYALARMLLRSAGASVGDGPSIPRDATHDAIRDYLANRSTETRTAGYFAANRISPLDEMHYLTRAAERAVYAADRLSNRSGKRAFCGGYRSSDDTAARRDSIAAALPVNPS